VRLEAVGCARLFRRYIIVTSHDVSVRQIKSKNDRFNLLQVVDCKP